MRKKERPKKKTKENVPASSTGEKGNRKSLFWTAKRIGQKEGAPMPGVDPNHKGLSEERMLLSTTVLGGRGS